MITSIKLCLTEERAALSAALDTVRGPEVALASGPAASRAGLLDRWHVLTRQVLPGMAAAQGWPIRLDHCFMRVCLDTSLGVRWDTVVRRPAVRHLTDAQLSRAVHAAERIAADSASLRPLNDASLRMRGKR